MHIIVRILASQKPLRLATSHENVYKIKSRIKKCNYIQGVAFEIMKLICVSGKNRLTS